VDCLYESELAPRNHLHPHPIHHELKGSHSK